MDLSEARGLVLFRVAREGIGISQRLSAIALIRLQAIGMLTLEPERLKDQPATTRESIGGDGRALHRRRSSGLGFQFLGVEVFSFLPQSQRNGCNLARQRETRHGGLDAFGQRSLVEILEWSGLPTRPGGGSFEQPFQIMVVLARHPEES